MYLAPCLLLRQQIYSRWFIYEEDICVLDYYLKLKSGHNIIYDATSSTDVFYHKFKIIVLSHSKSISQIRLTGYG